MDPEQSNEFNRIGSAVTTELRHHAYVELSRGLHVFQYLILPSFTPPIAWDVFRRPRAGHGLDHVLVRSSWRSDLDIEKLGTPVERLRHPYPLVPTVEVHALAVPSEALEQLAMELSQLVLPIGAAKGTFGADGVAYEVAVRQGSRGAANCRLAWWCKPPEAWSELSAWLERAEAVFEAAWAEHGPASALPLVLKPINDVETRQKAQRLFHEGHYGRAAELLADVAAREALTPAEMLMLNLAQKRGGDPSAAP